MALNVRKEVASMKRLTMNELRKHFKAVCGLAPRCQHRDWMIKKIAWQIQANVEGGLPERVRQRAFAITEQAALHKRSLKSFMKGIVPPPDPTTVADSGRPSHQLPPAGDLTDKEHNDEPLIVKVSENDFEFNGNTYATLPAFASAVSGLHVTGFLFLKPSDANETPK